VPGPAGDGGLFWRRPLDLGAEAGAGVGRYPPREHGEPYPWFVSALDADGNERAGVALPDVDVPVATHTGWFSRRPGTGGEGQNTDMMGSTIPFAPDTGRRREGDDPRPAIAERYRDRAEYVARARLAAGRLVEAGYLLADDLELVVRNAAERYDAFAGVPVESGYALPRRTRVPTEGPTS
jgi:Alpha/beta hydrolase domain